MKYIITVIGTIPAIAISIWRYGSGSPDYWWSFAIWGIGFLTGSISVLVEWWKTKKSTKEVKE